MIELSILSFLKNKDAKLMIASHPSILLNSGLTNKTHQAIFKQIMTTTERRIMLGCYWFNSSNEVNVIARHKQLFNVQAMIAK